MRAALCERVAQSGLQEAINHCPLGQRLHRLVGMGDKLDDLEHWGPDSLTKVFVTYVWLADVIGEAPQSCAVGPAQGIRSSAAGVSFFL